MSARRDAFVFLLAALVPAAAMGLLGWRALSNEEAATRREALLSVQTEADRLAASLREEIASAEPALAEVDLIGDVNDEALQLTIAESARRALPTIGEIAVLAPDGRLLFPREGRDVRERSDRRCNAAVATLAGRERDAAADTILASCEQVRDSRGRYVWPVLAVERAATDRALGERLAQWVDEHQRALRPEERTLLAAEVRSAKGLLPSDRQRITTALSGALDSPSSVTAAVQRAARGEEATRALRAAREQPGHVIPVRGAGVAGFMVGLRQGGFVLWVVTEETLARALASGRSARTLPAHLTANVTSSSGRIAPEAPHGFALAEEELGVEVRFLEPGAILRQSQRSERVLLTLIGVAVTIALSLSFALYRRMREARRTSELRTSFVAGVSHELRTPLASLRMLSELLSEGRVDESERGELLEAMTKETKRLSATVDRFMAYAKSERGKLSAHKRSHDVVALTRDRIAAFVQRNPDTQVDFSHDAPEIVVACDQPQIEIVIDNLLENALKYAPDGQPYAISLESSGRGVTLTVSDRGPGIPEARRHAVFDAFERGDARLSRATSGTGLGLFLVRSIARAHGGDAELVRGQGRGATFRVWLPLL